MRENNFGHNVHELEDALQLFQMHETVEPECVAPEQGLVVQLPDAEVPPYEVVVDQPLGQGVSVENFEIPLAVLAPVELHMPSLVLNFTEIHR